MCCCLSHADWIDYFTLTFFHLPFFTFEFFQVYSIGEYFQEICSDKILFVFFSEGSLFTVYEEKQSVPSRAGILIGLYAASVNEVIVMEAVAYCEPSISA